MVDPFAQQGEKYFSSWPMAELERGWERLLKFVNVEHSIPCTAKDEGVRVAESKEHMARCPLSVPYPASLFCCWDIQGMQLKGIQSLVPFANLNHWLSEA